MNFNPEKSNNNNEKFLFKNEHLKEGVTPIMGSILNRGQLNDEDYKKIQDFRRNGVDVDYLIGSQRVEREKFYNSGYKTYTISKIDSRDKYTEQLLSCTSVIGVGIDKETNENVSFLSHQDPERFLKDKNIQANFKNDLEKSIEDLINRCFPGTIDIVIVGGNKDIKYEDQIRSVDLDKMTPQDMYNFIDQQETGPFERYRKSINFLRKVISDKIGFSPIVLTGPNSNVKETEKYFFHNNNYDVYFDTEERRAYQVRVENESKNNESFSSDDINEKIKDYK